VFQLYSFDSGYSLAVLGKYYLVREGEGERIRYYIFFPYIVFVRQHISMAFFSGKRYFNDILWAQAYNNNTLSKI
jgi:hypothetical protein